ncbi:hypothetical protein AMTRI_Chr04g253050 [Amborella trichopoda]
MLHTLLYYSLKEQSWSRDRYFTVHINSKLPLVHINNFFLSCVLNFREFRALMLLVFACQGLFKKCSCNIYFDSLIKRIGPDITTDSPKGKRALICKNKHLYLFDLTHQIHLDLVL